MKNKKKTTVNKTNNTTGFDILKSVMLLLKGGKREAAKGIELQIRKNVRILGEKENYGYLGVLKEDIIKQAEIKEKKYTSDELENFSKPSAAAEITSKKITPGQSLCKILWTIFKMDKEKTRDRNLISINNSSK